MGCDNYNRALHESTGILLRERRTGNLHRFCYSYCSDVCCDKLVGTYTANLTYRPWLRRLQMPMRQKIAVSAILAMGCL
jgi:hypothetical protein